jgi:hypothetical protein
VNRTASPQDDGAEWDDQPSEESPGQANAGPEADPAEAPGAVPVLVWPPPEEDLDRWEVIAIGVPAAPPPAAADAAGIEQLPGQLPPAAQPVADQAPVEGGPARLVLAASGASAEDLTWATDPEALADTRDSSPADTSDGAPPDLLPVGLVPGAEPAPPALPFSQQSVASPRPASPAAWSPRRHAGRTVYLAVLGLTVILAASAGYFAAARMRTALPPPPTTATLAVSSDPEGMAVLVEGEPRGVTPLRLVLAAGPTGVEIDTPAGRRGLVLDLKPGSESSHYFDASTPPPTTPSAAAATGSIDVQSDPPGATVVLGGRQRGVTPLTVTDLGPGVHDVLLGYRGRSRRERVAVSAGRTSTLSVAFASPEPPVSGGTLRVRAPVELQVFRRGRALGSTARPLSLPPGSHDLTFVNERLEFRTSARVVITSGQATTFEVEVPPGSMSFNAAPWAEVWLGERKLGDTPLGAVTLPAGEHEFVFRHPDLGERRRTAVVPAGGSNRLAVDLRR